MSGGGIERDEFESALADATEDGLVSIEMDCVCGWTTEEPVRGVADVSAATGRAERRMREHADQHGWDQDNA